jgi:2-polyprenyl-3-methyl-5-hydroxy-6-metoxy-1,4-benzoquinol methylase
LDNYKETLNTWNKVAQLYQDKFMHLNLYDDTYDFFCAEVKVPNATILEIGCGPGNITSYLLNKRPDFKIEGIDFAPNMIELAKVNNPTAQFQVMDCREIDRLKSKFDAIVCGFCLPYLSELDCSKFIKDCIGLLNNEGLIYISFVEGDYSKSGFLTASTGDRTYFYYYPADTIISILKEFGFETIQLFNIPYTKSDHSEEIHTVIIARK